MPRLNPDDNETLGRKRFWVADIGGSHVTAAIVERGAQPRIVDRASADLETQGDAPDILESIASTLRRLAPNARRWVIALPGPFEYERGVGTFEGVAKFAALAGLDLRAHLSARLGIAAPDIRFVNDAIAYGIGEWYVAPHRPDRFVCITLGTGIGSAFLDSGRPIESGPDVPPQGWAHLLTIKGEPLEDSVSTRAIQRRYACGGEERLTVRAIAERARGGERRAVDVLEAAMFELGEALGPWLARFGATETVVGGSMARSWDILGAAFERGATGHGGEPIRVRAARLFDDAPLVGAAVFE